MPIRVEGETGFTLYRFAPRLFPDDHARAVQLAEGGFPLGGCEAAPVDLRAILLSQLRIVDALQLAEKIGFPSWVEVDVKKLVGTFKGAPERSEFGQDINESLVVELYSK